MSHEDQSNTVKEYFVRNEISLFGESDHVDNNIPELGSQNRIAESHDVNEVSAETLTKSEAEVGVSERTTIDMQQLRHAWGAVNVDVFGTTELEKPAAKRLTFSQSLGVTSQQPLLSEADKINLSLARSATYSSAIGSNVQTNVSSVIHDAARITHWDEVLSLCASNPGYASYAGRDGWTALHHACNRRCPRPEVVEALIKAYPEALLQEEEKGWLPLHYACRFKAPNSVVRLLLNLYPDSGKAAVAKTDKLGRTPLYYAIRYDAPDGVVGSLLEVDPSVVLEEDQNEESPLALVWDNWAEKMEGKRVISSYLNGAFDDSDDTAVHSQRAVSLQRKLQSDSKLRKRWLKVNVLLKATFGFPVEEDEEDADDFSQDTAVVGSEQRVWRIVHATAAVKCHLSLFLLALALHPEQAREYDEYDLRRPDDKALEPCSRSTVRQTALHLAASSNAGGEIGKTVLIRLLSLNQAAAEEQDEISGSLPLHLMVSNTKKQDWPNHAGLLYHFYPRAAQIPDNNGKLPLHRASAVIRHRSNEDDYSEKSDVVQLVRAYPQATTKLDNAGCLPFHYVAANAVIWDDDVESIYSANRNAVQARAGALFKNRMPIHMASTNVNSHESLIQKLNQLHPRGASIADSEGKLPFHLACEIGKDWETGGVRCTYDAFPNAIRQPETNLRGWLPLHMAAACRRSTSNLIVRLVELYPEAALVADRQGQFPLHLACGAGKDWEGGLKILFEANASALSTFDKWQRLPFYIAALLYCRGNPNSSAGTATIKPSPYVAALQEKTVNSEEAAELDILYQLLRADPSTALSFTS